MSSSILERPTDQFLVQVTGIDTEFEAETGLREVPAWAISLGVHLLVLLALASITRITILDDEIAITTITEEDLTPEDYKFDATVIDQVGTASDANLLSASQAAANHVSQDPQEKLEKQLEEELLTVNIPDTSPIPQPQEENLLEQVETQGATDHPGGVEGAIDRITFEIAGSLKDRKTLAIWLFDASQSQNERRKFIAERFENVYNQLGLLKAGSGGLLKTAVASFAAQTKLITPEPVDDVREVVKAVYNIQPETKSSKENVFSAVNLVTQKWLKYRTKMRRNVMIIIVTDERGDDYALLEETAHKLRRYGIRVYCVGNAAPFGREKGYVTWTYANGDQEDLPVDQGPETVAPERLQLAFWGGSGGSLNRMSASFGPYALTRLCAETGGMYLVAEQDRRGPKFDPAVMRNYQPDYRPMRDYQRELQTNRAKGALVQSAMATKADRIPTPKFRFDAPSDNVLRKQITEAQKPMAEVDYKLQEMLNLLSEGEKDRRKLKAPRWRASFDLAMGRVLAMRVRAFGYNTVLAEMKAAPKSFGKKDSNMWKLVPSRKIAGGPSVKKLAKKASEYLSRVIDEHPETPWALIAERELSQAMGWEWQEDNTSMLTAGQAGDAKRRIQLADDEKKRREKMRKRREARGPKPLL